VGGVPDSANHHFQILQKIADARAKIKNQTGRRNMRKKEEESGRGEMRSNGKQEGIILSELHGMSSSGGPQKAHRTPAEGSQYTGKRGRGDLTEASEKEQNHGLETAKR